MDLLAIQPHSVSTGVSGKHILFYGAPSTRKTTVAAGFPKTLLLATEIGYSFIPNVRAVKIDSWYTFKAVLAELKRPEVRAEYDTIAIDTLSLLSDLCMAYACSSLAIQSLSDIGYGKGWAKYNKELSGALNSIAQMGYGMVFNSHVKEIKNDEGITVGAEPVLDNTTKKIVFALTDLILFLNKEGSDKEQTVYAYSNLPESFLTKSRVVGFTNKFEFTFENLEKELKKAIVSSGVQVDEKSSNYISEVKIPLEELKAGIKIKGNKAVELGLTERANIIVTDALQGLTINEAGDVHYDQLRAIDLALTELIG